MITRGHIALLGSILVLGGAFHYQQKRLNQKPAAEIRIFPSLSSADIVNIALADPKSGELAWEIAHQGPLWLLKPGPKSQLTARFLDSGVFTNYIEGLAASKAFQLAEGEDGLGRFGLQSPRYILSLAAKDGQKRTLDIGDRTHDGSGLFVRTTLHPVCRLDFNLAPLLKSVGDLREPAVLPIPPVQVTKIVCTPRAKPSVVVELTRFKGRSEKELIEPVWTLKDGKGERLGDADPRKVDSVLNELHTLRVEEYLGKASDFKGEMKLEFYAGARDYAFQLEIDSHQRGYRPESGELLKVQLDPRFLKLGMASFQMRSLANFKPSEVYRINWAVGGEQFVGQLQAGHWTLVPSQDLRQDRDGLDKLVTELVNRTAEWTWEDHKFSEKDWKTRGHIYLYGDKDAELGKIELGPVSGSGTLVKESGGIIRWVPVKIEESWKKTLAEMKVR